MEEKMSKHRKLEKLLNISYHTVMSRIAKQKLSPKDALLKKSNRLKVFPQKEKK